MSRFGGRQVKVGIAKESSRGVAETPVYWIPHAEFGFADALNRTRLQPGVGTLEDSEQVHDTTKWAEGDLGGAVRSQAIGLLINSMLGSVSTSDDDPEAGTYTHTLTLDDSVQHPSLTLVVVTPNKTEAHRNVMLSSLEFTQELEDVLRFTASFSGKKAVGFSATTDYTADYKYSKQHAQFRVSGAVSGLSSASNLSFKDFSLTMNQNVAPDDALGTVEPEDFNNTNLAVEGSMTLNYTDDTWKNYQNETSYRALRAQWENTDVTIGSSTNPLLRFVMPRVDFYDWSPNYALDEIVSQELSYKASRDLENDQDMITVTLINDDDGTNY
jgi:hypothetical protein